VLQRNVKLYGPMNALDTANGSTCWYSEGTAESDSASTTSSSWFLIDFKRPVRPTELRIQFQAGFCAESCSVYTKRASSEWELVDDTLEWEDVHEIQSYKLSDISTTTTALKLVFDDLTDFYDRLLVYRLEVWGQEGATEQLGSEKKVIL
jgi:hypothetical protein